MSLESPLTATTMEGDYGYRQAVTSPCSTTTTTTTTTTSARWPDGWARRHRRFALTQGSGPLLAVARAVAAAALPVNANQQHITQCA